MLDQLQPPTESVRFPEERVAVARIQERFDFTGLDALHWGLDSGLIASGDVQIAEVSPTFRCSEACPFCPDSSLLLQEKIEKGEALREEDRISPEEMQQRVLILYKFGVRHFMIIGGTVDHLPELPDLISSTQHIGSDVRVSWFTDMIMQIDEKTGLPSVVLKTNLEHGWIKEVATHVSMDYRYLGDSYAHPELPPKRGRSLKFKQDGEYSRIHKSQYGAIGAVELIKAGVRRVVVNITVGPKNLPEVPAIYEQVAQMQQYATDIHSPTEVLLTFSPMIWRPHQARGDSPVDSPASGGLQMDDMPLANQIFSAILADTYSRMSDGRPRLLANSSGYTFMMVDPRHLQLVVNQELPYPGGRPEILSINPDGTVLLDTMFYGPELVAVNNIFGYRDRVHPKDKNTFVQFQPEEFEWFPNVVST